MKSKYKLVTVKQDLRVGGLELNFIDRAPYGGKVSLSSYVWHDLLGIITGSAHESLREMLCPIATKYGITYSATYLVDSSDSLIIQAMALTTRSNIFTGIPETRLYPDIPVALSFFFTTLSARIRVASAINVPVTLLYGGD